MRICCLADDIWEQGADVQKIVYRMPDIGIDVYGS